MGVLSIICAPASAPQLYVLPPQPAPVARFDPTDESIIEALRAYGRYGTTIWELLNPLASAQEHHNRAELRAARLALWARLRGLLAKRVVFRQGRKRISVVRLPPQGVRRKRRTRVGSTHSAAPDQDLTIRTNKLITNLLTPKATCSIVSAEPDETQSAEAAVKSTMTDHRREENWASARSVPAASNSRGQC